MFLSDLAAGLTVTVDFESNGLGGAPFAAAFVVSDHRGELAAKVHRGPIVGPVDPWVAKHVLPACRHIRQDCPTLDQLLIEVRYTLLYWLGRGAQLVTYVPVPVEATALRLALPGELTSQLPKLVDVHSLLLGAGHDSDLTAYAHAHQLPEPPGQAHDPLYDARLTDRVLRHLATTTTTGRVPAAALAA